ncbi:MAG: HAD family hydrolase [Acidobacteriota bacterium]
MDLRPAVFLDRDGTMNVPVLREGKSYPPATPEAFVLYPGVPEAVQRLRGAGFAIVVVTNQPDVGAGRQSRSVVEAINTRLREQVAVDDIRVCYHTDADDCPCRKPRPGMLLDAARALDLDLAASFMVGDRWRDVGAGAAAGCHTIFIRNDYAEEQPSHYHAAVGSLVEAVELILSWDRQGV